MRKAIMGLAAVALALPAVPAAAAAQRYNDGYSQRDRGHHYGERDRGRHYGERDRQDRGRYARYYDNRGYYNGPSWRGRDGRNYCRRSDGTTGLLIGGVAGALLGRSIDTRGDRAGGTLLGAAVGALLGSSIDRDGGGGRRCR